MINPSLKQAAICLLRLCPIDFRSKSFVFKNIIPRENRSGFAAQRILSPVSRLGLKKECFSNAVANILKRSFFDNETRALWFFSLTYLFARGLCKRLYPQTDRTFYCSDWQIYSICESVNLFLHLLTGEDKKNDMMIRAK